MIPRSSTSGEEGLVFGCKETPLESKAHEPGLFIVHLSVDVPKRIVPVYFTFLFLPMKCVHLVHVVWSELTLRVPESSLFFHLLVGVRTECFRNVCAFLWRKDQVEKSFYFLSARDVELFLLPPPKDNGLFFFSQTGSVNLPAGYLTKGKQINIYMKLYLESHFT